MKTYMAKAETFEHSWWVIDASGQSLGRLAAEVAGILRGKHRPTFTPHMDAGDHVIIINADKVVMTGKKGNERIYWHSQYPGGLKSVTRASMLAARPERLVERTIKGMLPHNRLGAALYRKLKVYSGPSHPHEAQNPQVYQL